MVGDVDVVVDVGSVVAIAVVSPENVKSRYVVFTQFGFKYKTYCQMSETGTGNRKRLG